MCRCAPRRRRCTPTPAMPRGFASRAGPGSGGRGRPWRRRAPARQTRGEGAHAGNAAAFVAGGLWANPEPQRAGHLVPKESTTVPPAPAAGPRADPVNRQRFPPPPCGVSPALAVVPPGGSSRTSWPGSISPVLSPQGREVRRRHLPLYRARRPVPAERCRRADAELRGTRAPPLAQAR